MKKYSDYFSFQRLSNKVVNRMAVTALIVMATATMAFAQDFTFIEGSVHSFSVENHDGNTFAWSFHDEAFNLMPDGSIDYIEGQFETDVTVQFTDLNRLAAEMVFLAVTETNQHGCSTIRAVKILLQPNNMYFDFASNSQTADCYNYGEVYAAQVGVGMDFNYREGDDYIPIPENRFPLKVKYTITNVTDGGTAVEGNSGDYVEIVYNAENEYILTVSEAVGEIDKTIEYELEITEVVDNYGTAITHDSNKRLQIRVINHLPQSGTMDMAMAYVITGIEYMGASSF